MIKNKRDLNRYMNADMSFYYRQSKKVRFMLWLLQDPAYQIAKYIRCLRMEEYYYNAGKGLIGTLLYLYFFRKKNILGNRLGLKIPKNCFGEGLTVYHHGSIIVNETAQVGKYCCLHGNNCIGNYGKEDISPLIGDYLDMGIGAKAIGHIRLGNHVIIGANAVVTHSFPGNNITLTGVPATRH